MVCVHAVVHLAEWRLILVLVRGQPSLIVTKQRMQDLNLETIGSCWSPSGSTASCCCQASDPLRRDLCTLDSSAHHKNICDGCCLPLHLTKPTCSVREGSKFKADVSAEAEVPLNSRRCAELIWLCFIIAMERISLEKKKNQSRKQLMSLQWKLSAEGLVGGGDWGWVVEYGGG